LRGIEHKRQEWKETQGKTKQQQLHINRPPRPVTCGQIRVMCQLRKILETNKSVRQLPDELEAKRMMVE
jgi:hypothetical protein